MKLAILFLPALLAVAQTQPPTPPPNGSISGVVRDAVSQEPVPNVTVATMVNATWSNGAVFQGRGARQVTSITDAQGRYSLKDLPPSTYSVTARERMISVSRMATLAPGQDLTLDFAEQVPGTIAGTVVDDNKEPMPEVDVFLVTKEYYLGATKYFLKGLVRTDDRGQYAIDRVNPGTPYLIMAQKRTLQLPAIAEDPADPKFRRQAFAPTFYPNSTAMDGGMPVTLRSRERREGVDIRVQRTPSFCVEGATQPAVASRLEIVEDQPSMGMSSGGGMFVMNPNASTGDDGKFRFCGLHPGTYRITVAETQSGNAPPPQFGVTTVTVRDEDVRGLKAPLAPGVTLNGEFVWDGPAPDPPPAATVNFSIEHLYRTQYRGEQLSARGTAPGEFTLHNVALDDYGVRATMMNAPGVYVKDVTYGGNSVLHAPFRMGSAMGDAGIKVILARDAGGAAFQVTEDNQPVGDARVYLFPADIRTEGELQARIFSGSPDQNGNYQTGSVLAPGKYFAIALRTPVDATPEAVGKLWQARAKAKEVQIAAGQIAQATLQPATLD